MRTLTVLNVAYPFAAAGPDAVGGAEQVLSLLDAALVEAGHRSIVVAAEGSTTRGTLLPTPLPRRGIDDSVRREVHAAHLQNICTALERYDIDVVHLHGIDFDRYLPPAGVPVLATLHLPPAWYDQCVFAIDRPGTFLHCVSRSQHSQCPSCPNLLPPIENGVPTEDLDFRCSKHRYTIALGRICPEKCFHVAIDASAHAGLPLLLGGQVFPYEYHERYFRQEIEPRLGATGKANARFLGPLGFVRKRRLLAGAQCLISASTAPETSSLVAMEALACGTPVVAVPSGALPEIVEHGVTGFLVNNQQEMAEAIGRCRDLDPAVCRREAHRRFSRGRMVGRYMEVYTRLSHVRVHAGQEAR